MKKLFVGVLMVMVIVGFGVMNSEAANFELTIQNVYDDTYRVFFLNDTSRYATICRVSIDFYNGNKWVTTRTVTFTSISPRSRGTAVVHLDGIKWNKYKWELISIR